MPERGHGIKLELEKGRGVRSNWRLPERLNNIWNILSKV